MLQDALLPLGAITIEPCKETQEKARRQPVGLLHHSHFTSVHLPSFTAIMTMLRWSKPLWSCGVML
jgi:hypothetical protein